MRWRHLTLRGIGRAAGFVLVAAAIGAAAYVTRTASSGQTQPARASAPADPLTDEMCRCQTLSMAGTDDAACEAVWAENRRRFFTYAPAPTSADAPISDKQ